MDFRFRAVRRACGSRTLAAAVLGLSAVLPAQAVWRQLELGPPGYAFGMAYDASRDRVVWFDNVCGPAGAQTWEFDGAFWQQVFPAVSPPSRTITAMAYDAHRKRTVAFGGYGSGILDDLWEYDGTTWTEVVTAVRPAARFAHMMAYDERRRHIVLFGGEDGRTTVQLDDTWTWDGTSWQEQMPATRPPGRSGAGFAYDSDRGRIVMFGGYRDGLALDETWEWDGTDWTQVQTPRAPLVRWSPGLAYDPQRRQTILFGGFGGSIGFAFADTWAYDGQDWTQLAEPGAGPLGRTEHGMIYDQRRGRIVVQGGTIRARFTQCFLDTWALEPPVPGFAGFGSGCPGAAGTPRLSLAAPLPHGGGTLHLRLSPLSTAPASLAAFAFGASRQQWGGLSLPAPLASLGFPLCSLWVGLDVIVPALPQAGIAELALRVPGSVVLHAQGLALDAGGLSLSGAATVDTAPR